MPIESHRILPISTDFIEAYWIIPNINDGKFPQNSTGETFTEKTLKQKFLTKTNRLICSLTNVKVLNFLNSNIFS